MSNSKPKTLRQRIAAWLLGSHPYTVTVDDSPGWASLTGRPHDYDPAQVLELYNDALEAWRKNPIAWRIIAITADYVVGDGIKFSSPYATLQRFIDRFWNHTQNRMDLRLESMCEELARSGDLFVLLFRNEADGMSYVRFITKDQISKIETAENDWERELVYYEKNTIGEPKKWYSPNYPNVDQQPAVMLHYSVNRPVGALLGESDLTTMLPWLQRYSRMLEDRVRLHWAMRAFLWFVTVPSAKVKEKQEQYKTPPESGSIIVKDEGEEWAVASPSLHGADAQWDMRAVRQYIDAGSGYPAHWRGEPLGANLATAKAMQDPTERHLAKRQTYFVYMLEDIIATAFKRAGEAGMERVLKESNYDKLFTALKPDISRTDEVEVSKAARDISTALNTLYNQMPGNSKTLAGIATRLVMQFAAKPIRDEEVETIITEAYDEKNKKPPQTGWGAPGR